MPSLSLVLRFPSYLKIFSFRSYKAYELVGLLKICSRKLATAVFSCSWDSARLHLDVMVDLTASYTRKS
ncbi:hypothetical protein Goari_026009 [Gossypium aridum]|uniref:Uncharacterized protein n=1 Tax=Gossypium aridum TaxID=34290 RepID=A0A7J8XAX4_GOSAI|nr:hypothetical protein [Gossypium aridum]